MNERMEDRVIVPNLVGLPVHVGRDVAAECGVTLANPDPAGPPIGSLTWPGLFYITSQNPPARTEVYRWDSVAVEIVGYGEAEREALRNSPVSPPADAAHAKAKPLNFIDPTPTDGVDQNPV